MIIYLASRLLLKSIESKIDKPVSTLGILSDGINWQYIVNINLFIILTYYKGFQLNTLNFENDEGERNVVWRFNEQLINKNNEVNIKALQRLIHILRFQWNLKIH